MEVRYPPPEKGYLSDTGAIPFENKADGCDTPLCDTISKGYCAIWGVSRTGPLSAQRRFQIPFGCFQYGSFVATCSRTKNQPKEEVLVPTLCRADLGCIFYFGPANFRKIHRQISQRILMANFDC